MKKILTAAQMREIDRRTIEERGIPGLVLMENAGVRVYEVLAIRFSPLNDRRVVILCGKGNNGGDGLVVARQMVVRGEADGLTVVLVGDPGELQGDAATNYSMLRAVDYEPVAVRSAEDWQQLRPQLLTAQVIVDALLGTGLRGPAKGIFLEIIRDLNTNFGHAEVIAVDMPSGMPSDSGEPGGKALRASRTITFTAPKVSQIFPPNCEQVGELTIAPIGTARSMLDANPQLNLALLEGSDFAHLFAPRDRSAHKGNFGHVFVIGGSPATPGAVLMAATSATAALRSGAGLVTAATSRGAVATMVAHTPELMTLSLPENADGSFDVEAFDMSLIEGATVLALGPGIGTAVGSRELARKIVREAEQPLVVDADGLNALAEAGDWQAASRMLVLTPHPGEMARLTGLSTAEVQSRRVEVTREFAVRRNAYVVLKGNRTLTATPEGMVLVNPTGTPAMATAGAGDILTGIMAGLLAQFPAERFPDQPPEIVIAAAVYLHGLAAEIAAAETTEPAMLATDILRFLPEAIKRLTPTVASNR